MGESLAFETKAGIISVTASGGYITALDFGAVPDAAASAGNELLLEAKRQLLEYFDGKRREFDLPLKPEGTAFRMKVWQALRGIPYGETRSYAQIAAEIGNPKASRAVGGANHNNPISIIIPCHRVIGASGRMVGYGGGVHIKKLLLELEKGYAGSEKL